MPDAPTERGYLRPRYGYLCSIMTFSARHLLSLTCLNILSTACNNLLVERIIGVM